VYDENNGPKALGDPWWLAICNKKQKDGEFDLASTGEGDDVSWEQNNFKGIIEKITEDFESCKAWNKARRDALIAMVCGKL